MLDINYIRDNIDAVKENIKNRHMTVDIDRLLELDEQRREFILQVEELRSVRNKKSKGKPSDADIAKMKEVGDQIKYLEGKQKDVAEEYKKLLSSVPNMAHPDAPVGQEKDFSVLETIGSPKKFSFSPKTHDVLMQDMGVIDFERGAKVAGSKSYFLKGDLVRLNLALLQYGIDMVTEKGFELCETPDMAKNEILQGIGFNPRGEETQVYSIEGTDMSLIGTAEITMGGYHSGEVIDLEHGPKKYAAISHCFRTEAGAYGKANRGLYRVHQFSKLELFVYCKPEDSPTLHQDLLDLEKEICNGLEIPYRVIDTPTGDLGAPAYRKFDIEAWMVMNAGEGEDGGYGEITSASNCTDYQARRLNIKFKNEEGKTEYVHTLNGTAVVMSRFPLALFENHQQEDGSIAIPKKLQPYFGSDIIKKQV